MSDEPTLPVEQTEATVPTEPAVEEPTTPTEATEPTQPTEETIAPTEPQIDTENLEKSLEENGVNFEELKEEYVQNGDLSEATREKLHKLGLTDEFINDYIEAKKAQIDKQVAEERAELEEHVGGKEQFDSIIKWAAENLSQEEIASINEVRSMPLQKLILEGLKVEMEKAEGVVPTLVTGGAAPTTEMFESQAQMFEAIRDKRYLSDPAYQAKVTAKIRASRKAGINLGI